MCVPNGAVATGLDQLLPTTWPSFAGPSVIHYHGNLWATGQIGTILLILQRCSTRYNKEDRIEKYLHTQVSLYLCVVRLY